MKIHTHLVKAVYLHVLMVSFLLGGVGALMMGLQQSLRTAEESIRPALKVVVFVQGTISDADAEKWAHSLPSINSEIDSVQFVSRQDAFQQALATPALAKSLLLLRENPFPASVLLRFKDGAWLDRPEPTALIKTQAVIQEIRWDPEGRSIFRSFRQWRLWLERLTVFTIVLLGVWGFFGIYRFLAMKAPVGELLIHLGVGLIGGSLAIMTWGLALKGVGSDAALYRPESISFWPLLTALMAALATFGWDVSHEK